MTVNTRLVIGAIWALCSMHSMAVGAEEKLAPILLIVGPVERINEHADSATILKRTLVFPALDRLAVGDGVAVFGVLHPDGQIVVSKLMPNGQYVPGSSPVLLTAVMEQVSAAVGRVVVGGVVIDITRLPALRVPEVGSLVQVVGTQPNIHGVILAESLITVSPSRRGVGPGRVSDGVVQEVNSASDEEVRSESVQGISGGSLQGISGGSVQGISGGSFQKINRN